MRAHESAPLVNDGVMFVTSPANQVLALDARTGAVRWRYQRPRPPDGFVLHDTNRGVALYGDKVFFAAGEAVLVALDARTGREVWATNVADNRSAYYLDAGAARGQGPRDGGRIGRRVRRARLRRGLRPRLGQGALAHLHRAGARRDPAATRWPKGEQWRTGGAPVWVTGTYDPEKRAVVLGHRQRRPVGRRSAPRRQPARRVHAWRSTSPAARSTGTSSTTRTSRGTGTRCRRRS